MKFAVLLSLVLGACVPAPHSPPAVTADLPAAATTAATTTTTTAATTTTTTTTTTAAAAVAATVPVPEVCLLDGDAIRGLDEKRVREMQREVGAGVDGQWGPKSRVAQEKFCAGFPGVSPPPPPQFEVVPDALSGGFSIHTEKPPGRGERYQYRAVPPGGEAEVGNWPAGAAVVHYYGDPGGYRVEVRTCNQTGCGRWAGKDAVVE